MKKIRDDVGLIGRIKPIKNLSLMCDHCKPAFVESYLDLELQTVTHEEFGIRMLRSEENFQGLRIFNCDTETNSNQWSLL